MSSKKKKKVVESEAAIQTYSARLLKAKVELIKDAKSVVEFLIKVRQHCGEISKIISKKYDLNPASMLDWYLQQVDIYAIFDEVSLVDDEKVDGICDEDSEYYGGMT